MSARRDSLLLAAYEREHRAGRRLLAATQARRTDDLIGSALCDWIREQADARRDFADAVNAVDAYAKKASGSAQ